MAAALGSLVVSLEANTAQFNSAMDNSAYQTEKAMAQMMRDAEKVGRSLGTLGVIAAVGLSVLVKQSIDAADNLRDLGQKTGIAVEKLNGLGFAASQAGGSLESMGAAAGKLNKAISEAAGGADEPGEAFRALGIEVEDAAGNLKKADVIMAEVADKFAEYQDGPEKSAIALRLFGKAGADMIPLLNDGGAALLENIAYAERYSGVTRELADASDQFNDTMGKLKLQQDGFANAMATAVLPILQAVANEVLGAAEGSDKFALASAAVRTVLETFVVIGSEVAFVFKGVGTEIGGIAAQLVALSTLDFQGFNAISEAMKADAELARKEHDKFIDSILNRPAAIQFSGRSRIASQEEKPNAPRLPGSGSKTDAAQLAKAQLDYDLAQVKAASDQVINTYANAEKIMESMRAANLIDEKTYWEAKAGFITVNAAAQETALQQEIARLQAEKLTGKEKIENAKKIDEAKAKLAKVRADASASAIVVSNQETDANEKIAKSYIDATKAAEAYIKTVTDRNARELAGLGRGTKYRDEEAGRNGIEDKFTAQRQGLERDLRNNEITQQQFDDYLAVAKSTYETEIALYNARTAAINAKNGDWTVGASEALNNYLDSSRNVANQTEVLFTNAFQGMEDAIVNFVKTGKLDFKSLAENMIADLARIQARAAMSSVTSSLGSWMKGLFSSTGAGVIPMQEGGGYHSGGIVGGEPTFSRTVSSSFFSGAPKYHTGGIAGDEVPAILKKGEGVFTPGQMKAMGGGSSAPVTVNVSVDASGSSVQSNAESASELGRRIAGAVRSILIQEKRPNGLLAG